MLNNDILRSLRYMLKTNNPDRARIFALAGTDSSAEQIVPWLRKEDEEGFVRCPDVIMSAFLNGIISDSL